MIAIIEDNITITQVETPRATTKIIHFTVENTYPRALIPYLVKGCDEFIELIIKSTPSNMFITEVYVIVGTYGAGARKSAQAYVHYSSTAPKMKKLTLEQYIKKLIQ